MREAAETTSITGPPAPPGNCLDAERLRRHITALRSARETEVMGLLEAADDSNTAMPSLVTLKHGPEAVKLLAADLLLCTAPGRFDAARLAASSVIESPAWAGADAAFGTSAVRVMAQLFKGREHGCSGATLPALIQLCNYLGAEGVLDGVDCPQLVDTNCFQLRDSV